MTTSDFKYLIVGGGMTGDAASHGIRDLDSSGSIGLVGAEPHPPYNRPPLSKGLWKGDPAEGIWRAPAVGVESVTGRRIVSVDPRAKRASDDKGTTYGFEKLLFANGGAPRRLPFESEQVIYFRTWDDYRALRALSDKGSRFAVIGGGFIGSEIAAGLRMQGRDVVMIVPEKGLGARVFPADLSSFLVNYYKEKGVDVRTGEGMTGLTSKSGKAVVKTTTGELTADSVVAGLGIIPSTDVAEKAGIVVDNGIVVGEKCQTNLPGIYAAGDVANFFNPSLGARMRVEHEDNANSMGRAAGRAMAGANEPYDHLPSFYSDLFDLGYEAVGDTDARLETVADWKEPFREGVVYYLKDRRVRGVLLWGMFGQVDAARKLIAQPGPFTPQALKGRISA